MPINASSFEKRVYSCFQQGQQRSYICQRSPILWTVVNIILHKKPLVNSVIFGDTDEDTIKIETMKTKGGSGSTKLDTDGWRKN